MFKVINNCNKKLHFKIYQRVLRVFWVFRVIYFGYFVRFTFSTDLFLFLLSFFKLIERQLCSQMFVQGRYYKHCIGCETRPNLTAGTPEQFLSYCFEVLINFGQAFALFLGAFMVDFEYSCFIVNVIKFYLMA